MRADKSVLLICLFGKQSYKLVLLRILDTIHVVVEEYFSCYN